MDCRLCPRPPVLSVKWLRPGSEECKMATEGSNLHDDGGGRTDNRPAYSCHSRQKAGSILEEEPRRAAGGTTNRSHPATAAACSLSKASGVVEPVATNCSRCSLLHLIRLTCFSTAPTLSLLALFAGSVGLHQNAYIRKQRWFQACKKIF